MSRYVVAAALAMLPLLPLLNAAPAEKKLAIVRVAFAQSEDGAAIDPASPFLPGESIYFSCQVEGYKRSDNGEVFLTYELEARDARGVLLQPMGKDAIATTLSEEDKEWMPKIRETIVVPPLADSGKYQIVVRVKDELVGRAATAEAAFLVRGRDVAPSDTLTVRNFRFLRTDEDGKPLQVAAYRPGDTVWARFDMTGYKFGDKNAFDIEYGITVLRADGTVAYSEPHAAEQKAEPLYPPRYQPGVLSLNLAKDQKLGEYTIVLAVRDNVGGQKYEAREKFSVE